MKHVVLGSDMSLAVDGYLVVVGPVVSSDHTCPLHSRTCLMPGQCGNKHDHKLALCSSPSTVVVHTSGV